jgi:hypothetical protein
MLRREQALPTAERRTRQRFRRYGVSRARPLARRDWITLRPFRVAIRARKPWVRARLMRLGWKVRFIFGSPVKKLECLDIAGAGPQKGRIG